MYNQSLFFGIIFFLTQFVYAQGTQNLQHLKPYPISICGMAINDGPAVYIQYGPNSIDKVYLRSNPNIDAFAADRLPGRWCAFSDALPVLNPEGHFEINALYLQSDWNKSGFSVGNL